MSKTSSERRDPPNWFDLSVISDPQVNEVLNGLLEKGRMKKRWGDLAPAHRRLHQDILRGYLRSGHAPSRAQLQARLSGPVDPALEDLVQRDLILLDAGAVTGAYPFTSRASRHKVSINGQDINAMCAIDALGAGAMAGRDARVRSQCAQCDTPIKIGITENGLAIRCVQPAHALVWAGVKPVSGCAADTQCRSLLLFCNRAHLEAWRTAKAPDGQGWCLTPAQALQVGAAIFRPFLTPKDRPALQV